MKKTAVLLIGLTLCMSVLCIPASAAVPTAITTREVSAAPKIDGVIDGVYGQKIFDVKATDHSFDSEKNNFYPKTLDEYTKEMLAVRNVMRNIGYMIYDKDNLYLIFDVTDHAPKAAADSSKSWHSTSIQLLLWVNQERCWPTFAYMGKSNDGKHYIKAFDDAENRCCLDYSKIEYAFALNSETSYTYEVKIPWTAIPDVKNANDVKDLRMGVVQASMSAGYVCSAFGEAFSLKYNTSIPVTLQPLSGAAATTSSKTDDTNSMTASVTSGAATQSTSGAGNDDGTAPNSDGIDIKEGNTTQGNAANTQEHDTEETIIENQERSWTLIIILIVAAIVVIAGGAAVIFFMNKKKTVSDTAEKTPSADDDSDDTN